MTRPTDSTVHFISHLGHDSKNFATDRPAHQLVVNVVTRVTVDGAVVSVGEQRSGSFYFANYFYGQLPSYYHVATRLALAGRLLDDCERCALAVL